MMNNDSLAAIYVDEKHYIIDCKVLISCTHKKKKRNISGNKENELKIVGYII